MCTCTDVTLTAGRPFWGVGTQSREVWGGGGGGGQDLSHDAARVAV